MFRGVLLGVLTLASLAAGSLAWVWRRRNRQLGEHNAVQWPFDQTELRSLMKRVVDEQRQRVAAIEDVAGRARAQAFLEYYERRREAIAS